MATLIPANLADNPAATQADRIVARLLIERLPASAWAYWSNDGERPSFIAFGPKLPILAIGTSDAPSNGIKVVGLALNLVARNADLLGELSLKVENLRRELGSLTECPAIVPVLFLPNVLAEDISLMSDRLHEVVVTKDRLATWECLANGNGSGLDQTDEIRALLYPEITFVARRRKQSSGREAREDYRFQLDREQQSAAMEVGVRTLLITGPSGSGKTLALAARARLLGRAHPDNTVEVLCYNKALVPYLKGLTEDAPNVIVDTIFGWFHRHLPGINPDDPRSLREAIRAHPSPDGCAGILVDEGQDFDPLWFELLAQAVPAHGGGLAVAADEAQSLYREERLTHLKATQVIHFRKNYRSTTEIGTFAIGAVFGLPVDDAPSARRPATPEFVSHGGAVKLVHAASWDHQADFVAAAIRALMSTEQLRYSDFAVLTPQHSGVIHRLLPRLGEADIPFYWVSQDKASKAAVDWSQDTVKVSTVHSAKGLEFAVVIVFALEALRVPADLASASVDDANRTRVAYVGMTRARDLLVLTYTRRNAVIDRALQVREWTEQVGWPDDLDDEEMASWLE